MIVGLLALAALTEPVPAPAFDFAGLRTSTEIAFADPVLKACVGSEANGSCALRIASFADIPILHSIVVIKERRLQKLFVHASSTNFSQAVEAFKAKYGKPAYVDVRPINGDVGQEMTRMYTWQFSDGVLSVLLDDRRPQFSVSFGSNRKITPKIDF